MLAFTPEQWLILLLAFVLGLILGMAFLASPKWKRRYREEVARREEVEAENQRLRRDSAEMDSLRTPPPGTKPAAATFVTMTFAARSWSAGTRPSAVRKRSVAWKRSAATRPSPGLRSGRGRSSPSAAPPAPRRGGRSGRGRARR